MSRPQFGSSVWLQNDNQLKGRNGTVISIDWSGDKEVIVRFDDGDEVLEWEQFDNFNERLNQWIIHR